MKKWNKDQQVALYDISNSALEITHFCQLLRSNPNYIQALTDLKDSILEMAQLVEILNASV